MESICHVDSNVKHRGCDLLVVLRAGLLSASASTCDASPLGFAAVAALVGLFLAQALEKLQDVFSTLFTAASKGDNYTPAAAAPAKVTGFSPNRGSVGEEVVSIGTDLGAAHAGRFNAHRDRTGKRAWLGVRLVATAAADSACVPV